MGLFSRIIGAYIGFSLGGPLGAIAGAALAGLFDQDTRRQTSYQFTSQEESQTVFFVATFSLLGKLSKVDGHVSHEEIEVIENFMYEQLKLDQRAANFAQRIFDEAKRSPHDYHDYARQFANHFRSQPHMLQMMVDLLLRVAVADQKFDKAEEDFITEVATIFGLSDSLFDHLKKQYTLTTDHHYAVLDLEPTASNEEIKRKYKKLVLEHHPDRAVSEGMPEEFKELAQKKFIDIQQSYELIKKERGF